MKKIDTFLRGIMFICCLSSMTMFAQTYNGTGGVVADDGNCNASNEFILNVPAVDAGNVLATVTVDITHTWNDDLDISLIAPDGTTSIILSSDNGGSGDNYVNVIFDDNAATPISSLDFVTGTISGTYSPEEPLSDLSAFGVGNWTLVVCDDFDDSSAPNGSLNSWSLTFAEVEEPEPVDGESCENPITIACGTSDPGSTSGFAPNAPMSSCGTTINTAPGVYYKLEGYGNGDLVTASLCGSSYDTKIAVFSGDCSGLTCVTGNDDECGVQSEVTFGVSAGTDYYIYVTGYQSNSGSYTLNVTCEEPLPGQTCETAEFMECGDTVNDSTADYNSSSLSSCDTTLDSAPGRFYFFEGDGNFVTASLCGSSYDTKIGVFEGACGSLVCVAGNDDACSTQSEVTFPTANGTLYYVYVTGFGSANGAFTLNLTCIPPPENDVCTGAIALECGEIATGNTTFATSEALADCDGLAIDTAPGLWHSVVGTGGDIEIDLSGSDYDTKLAIFSGDCGTLTCVASDDDGGDGVDSKLTFASNAGETYYVYVTGFGTNSGIYTLSVDCICDVYIEEGECVKVFSGYGPTSSVELNAVGLYGSGIYDYEWSDGQTGATVTVTPTEQTTYTVTLTDSEGCTSTASTTVLFENVVCNDNPNNVKVNVCHNGDQICVSPNAVQAHLNHGDTLGACDVVVDCDTAPVCDSRLKRPGPDATDVATALEISWGAATGLVDGYILSVGTTPGGIDIIDSEDVGNSLTYDLSGLNFLTTYYVTIVPYNGNGQATGCESSVFTTGEGPWCSAETIACDGTAIGNTITDGVISDYLDTCFTTFLGAEISSFPGVFYQFEGTGDNITASLCGTNTDSDLTDTIIGVYTGDCLGLTCLTGNDDSCSLLSEVEFASEVGTTYYIYVAEFSTYSDGGEFELSLTCTPPPPPLDACVNAEFIECASGTVNGDTTGLAANDIDSCGGSANSGAGKFYVLEGTGDIITVDTNGTSYDTQLAVFTGDCGNGGANLVCIDGDDDGGDGLQSEVTFPTLENNLYYIYVTGFGTGNFGPFTLNIECEEAPEPLANETCSTAITLDCGVAVDATTIGATGTDTETGIGSCDSGFDSAPSAYGAWFTFVGDGTLTTVTADALGSFDHEMVISTGSCGSLTNVDCSDSGFGGGIEAITFQSTSGQAYYVYVAHWSATSSTTGDFTIEVSSCQSREAPTTVSTPTWNLYPNPSTTGEVQVDLSNYLNQDVSIQMTDFHGKILSTNNLSNVQNPRYRLSTQGMSHGIYFVRVATESGVSTKKLIIANR
ncbi:T9SS type A sorting domain-containing protein [Hanstruepera flava]|uniref:T9SS type A sorting domain-containing protein n=1 Tax=Hanstruepera flava TaxID=2930218 RepID=UPI002027AE3B|nr:T9SS type A sorting domain-containing protein [Hanstruepera flava]